MFNLKNLSDIIYKPSPIAHFIHSSFYSLQQTGFVLNCLSHDSHMMLMHNMSRLKLLHVMLRLY